MGSNILGSNLHRLDIFGHEMSMFYTSAENKKRSDFGAITTILFSLAGFFYIASLITTRKEDLLVNQFEYFVNLEQENAVSFKNTSTMFMASFVKQTRLLNELEILELPRYINITFA